jgi:hypothetical protein
MSVQVVREQDRHVTLTETTGAGQSASKKMVAPVVPSWKSVYTRASYRLQAPPVWIWMEKLWQLDRARHSARHPS